MTNLGRPDGPPAVRVSQDAVVDWRLPDGPPDWLLGAGTTRGERILIGAATAVGAAAVVAVGDPAWRWWHWVLVVVLAADVVGGVTANALSTAKRQYHAPRLHAEPTPGTTARVLRSSPLFTAAHVHPFLVALVLPGADWGWAATWYLGCLAAVVAVHRAPLHLARPLAFAAVTTLVVAAPLVPPPPGLAWFGPVLALKLVTAHAVREEPYRPLPRMTDPR